MTGSERKNKDYMPPGWTKINFSGIHKPSTVLVKYNNKCYLLGQDAG